jgi:hypothetical protein
MPTIEGQRPQANKTPGRKSVAVMCAHENDLRRRWVLVKNDVDQGALCVLLRFEGAESAPTRARLRTLGFRPTSSPATTSVGWRFPLHDAAPIELACSRLREVVGGAAALDLGACFGATPREYLRRAREARYWPGPFLVGVGGTRRVVLFDLGANDAELERAFDEARADFDAHDFHAPTE